MDELRASRRRTDPVPRCQGHPQARVERRRERGDAKDYYTKHPADFEQPELAHVRHILLFFDCDPARARRSPPTRVAAKRKQAEACSRRAKGGEDFAKWRRILRDPGPRKRAGELPEFARGQDVPNSRRPAFAFQGSQPAMCTSAYGFHIIKLLDKTARRKLNTSPSPQTSRSPQPPENFQARPRIHSRSCGGIQAGNPGSP